MTTIEQTPLKTHERWAFAAQLLFAAGSLCLTISQLVNMASEGRITEITSSEQRSNFKSKTDFSATDYFRR